MRPKRMEPVQMSSLERENLKSEASPSSLLQIVWYQVLIEDVYHPIQSHSGESKKATKLNKRIDNVNL